MPTLADLERINAEVNEIPYTVLCAAGETPYIVKDTPDGGRWVCSSYTTRKARLIQEAGFDQQDFSAVLCWTEPCMPPDAVHPEGRERHEVLAVNLDGAIWIMDSRYDEVGMWQHPPWDGYRWEHQQVPGSLVWRDASEAGLV